MSTTDVKPSRSSRDHSTNKQSRQIRLCRVLPEAEFFPDNRVITAKYTVKSFVPKFLFSVFSQYANLFFLCVALLQQIPRASPTGQWTTVIPLTTIIIISAIKDIYEDFRRHQEDEAVNKCKTTVLRRRTSEHLLERRSAGVSVAAVERANIADAADCADSASEWEWADVNWDELRVGDVIQVRERQRFPADVVLLSTSEPAGAAYIETANLDGETSLKMRQCASGTLRHIGALTPTFQPSCGVSETDGSALPGVQHGESRIQTSALRIHPPYRTGVLAPQVLAPRLLGHAASRPVPGLTLSADSPDSRAASASEAALTAAIVECEAPNPNLYSFSGIIRFPVPSQAQARAQLTTSSAGARAELEIETDADAPDSGSVPTRHVARSTRQLALSAPIAVTNEQLVQRGTTLRNTRVVLAAVAYTGSETKIVLNSDMPRLKRSSLDQLVNQMIILLIGILLVLMMFTFFSRLFFSRMFESGMWYLGLHAPDGHSAQEPLLVQYGFSLVSSFILFHTIIPISLAITVEGVKFIQSYLLTWDLELYDAAADRPAAAHLSSLSEELGLIRFVFSDKTGTLTQNKMRFSACSVGGFKFAIDEQGEIDPRIHEILRSQKDEVSQRTIREFLITLAICHTVNVEHVVDEAPTESSTRSEAAAPPAAEPAGADGPALRAQSSHTEVLTASGERIRYAASSPDEAALVLAAAKLFDYKLVERSQELISLEVNGVAEQWMLLHVLSFSSDRKRQSVVVRDPRGRLLLYCKGADSVIVSRLAAPYQQPQMQPTASDTAAASAIGESEREEAQRILCATTQHLLEFGDTGLRTLCLAMGYLDEELYARWLREYYYPATALVGEARVRALDTAWELIERNLYLLGATAIEDRLQDGVPETLEALRNADIRVWMLTGDKFETAVNIGFAAKLLTKSMILLRLVDSAVNASSADLEGKINEYLSRMKRESSGASFALVIDGSRLQAILNDKRAKEKFVELALDCCVVICCRVSPMQKADVVDLVKTTRPDLTTLAIGDGANDVTMIQRAHVGIGIAGEEGMQAATSADYAISQFRFLRRLLFVHGAWSYRRVTSVVLYSFYKNFAMYISQLWFALFNCFSGQTLFDPLCLMAYNVIFTATQPLALGLLDRPLDQKLCMRYAFLYPQWPKPRADLHFGLPALLKWIANGLYHSAVIFFTHWCIFHDGLILRNGLVGGQELLGLMIYFSLVLVVSVKAGLEQRAWIFPHTFICVIGSFVLCYVLLPLASVVPLANNGLYGTAMTLFTEPFFWLLQPLVLVLCLLPDVVWLVVRRTLWPDPADLLGDAHSYARAQRDSPESLALIDRLADQLVASNGQAASRLPESSDEVDAQAVGVETELNRGSPSPSPPTPTPLLLADELGSSSAMNEQRISPRQAPRFMQTGACFSQDEGESLRHSEVARFSSVSSRLLHSVEAMKPQQSLEYPQVPHHRRTLTSQTFVAPATFHPLRESSQSHDILVDPAIRSTPAPSHAADQRN